MRKPMPAESAPIDTPVPRTFFSRMFRWGIGFWLLLWIGAICLNQFIECEIKGLPPGGFGMAAGSVFIGFDENRVSSKHDFKLGPTRFVWSDDTFLRLLDSPTDYLALLGPLVLLNRDATVIGFPISGFLWLWLIWGWWLQSTRLENPPTTGKWRTKIRIAILTLIPVLSLFAGQTLKGAWTRESDASHCLLNIRNIQQAMRGYQSTHELIDGSAVPWAAIFGPGGYTKPRCPSGCEYELSPVIPEMGKPAARCPNPEHQRRLEERERKNPRIW